ncbi:hypothetical protein [Bradyrhizobium sp. BR13661]|jgi:hypothetical protein|nr:hypothetical protein [Bradyrhizobium sp. BR13661]
MAWILVIPQLPLAASFAVIPVPLVHHSLQPMSGISGLVRRFRLMLPSAL